MNKAGEDFENCYVCGNKLKYVAHKRNTMRRCHTCIDLGLGAIKPATKQDEELEDWSVLDDPRAVNEKEYGRVFREPTQIYTGHSSLSSIVTSGSNYEHKHGAAREGYRHKRNDKKE